MAIKKYPDDGYFRLSSHCPSSGYHYRIFKDKEKNFALKLIAYRRIAENIRKKYPHSKLMLASWDFCGFWSIDEVAVNILVR